MMVALASLALAAWCAQWFLAWRITRAVPPLSSARAEPLDRWPRLTMVVPARDEARRVEAALRSKLSCGYPELELVAVDDRSTDGTGDIFARVAAEDPRVKTARVDALPAGWLGKLNAMATGLRRATGEWVLFSDADVHVEPGVLQRLIAWCERERVDVAAVFPRIAPAGAVIDAALTHSLRVLSLSGRIWKANDDASHVGLGVGAFTLARRRWLDETDALSVLRMEVADDVALGALLKQRGARTRIFAGRDEVHLHFLETFEALARSADKGGGMLGFSLPRTLALALLPAAFEVGVPLAALASGGAAAALGLACLAVATAAHLTLNLHFRCMPWSAPLWPLGSLVTAYCTLRSGLRAWRRQGVSWRDTFYPRDVLEAGRRLQITSMRVIVPPP